MRNHGPVNVSSIWLRCYNPRGFMVPIMLFMLMNLIGSLGLNEIGQMFGSIAKCIWENF